MCPITLNIIKSHPILIISWWSNPGAVPANFSECISRRAKPSSAAAAMASESHPSGARGADAAGKCQSVPIKTHGPERSDDFTWFYEIWEDLPNPWRTLKNVILMRTMRNLISFEGRDLNKNDPRSNHQKTEVSCSHCSSSYGWDGWTWPRNRWCFTRILEA